MPTDCYGMPFQDGYDIAVAKHNGQLPTSLKTHTLHTDCLYPTFKKQICTLYLNQNKTVGMAIAHYRKKISILAPQYLKLVVLPTSIDLYNACPNLKS